MYGTMSFDQAVTTALVAERRARIADLARAGRAAGSGVRDMAGRGGRRRARPRRGRP